MREAVGSSILLYLMIPIIILLIFFISFIMNYSSAYRAVNDIIAQIEAGGGGGCGIATSSQTKSYVKDKYYYMDTISCGCTSNSRGSVYDVTLKVNFELPIFGKIGVYDVKSETKTIYDVFC